MNLIKLGLTVSAVSLITACGGGGGGGGGSDSSSNDTQPPAIEVNPLQVASDGVFIEGDQDHLALMGFETARNDNVKGVGVNVMVMDFGFNTNHNEFNSVNIPFGINVLDDSDPLSDSVPTYDSCEDIPNGTYPNLITSVNLMTYWNSLLVEATSWNCRLYDTDVNIKSKEKFSSPSVFDVHGAHVSGLIFGETFGGSPDANFYVFSQSQGVAKLPADDAGDDCVNVTDAGCYSSDGSGFESYLFMLGDTIVSESINIINISQSSRTQMGIRTYTSEDMKLEYQKIVDNSSVVIQALGNDNGKEVDTEIDDWIVRIQDSELLNDNIIYTGANRDLDDNLNPFYYLNAPRKIYEDSDLSDGFIYVGSVNDSGRISSFSNVPGSNTSLQQRTIFAVGENIPSATSLDNTSTLELSGTSMATPIVSSAVAVIMECSGLTAQAAAQVLLDTATTDFSWYSADIYGAGILNLNAAYDQACSP